MIAWIFAIVVIAIVGKLMYDVQQKKNKPTQTEDGFEFKDDFQKLAGIKPIETTTSELPTNVTTKKLNEQIVEALLKAAENSEFPKPDESINVRTTKITTIDTNFGSDNDPLATIPMSRVSKEGKKKMAQIAKEDIKITTEANASELISKGLVTIPAKKKSNPKQMDGTKSDAPFVKTKKKSTKSKVTK
jgi:hypothetical protein